jgi:ADP-heptose:LPS heptosyltransferase
MHILESYALTAGCKIGKSFIHEEKIGLPNNKYITFHPYSSKGSSKQYEKWPEVLDLLKSNKKFDYEIIQIGEKNDLIYSVNSFYLGKTSYNSLAYLIKHSSLHLGFDSFPVHLASFYGKKIVCAYSYYASTCGPYFSDMNDIAIFEPNFGTIKPIYGYDDPFKLIDTIDPNEIYKSVLDKLQIK